MRQSPMSALLVAFVLACFSGAHAQEESAEDLRAEVEALREKLELLEKENELLRREIELMKREAQADPAGSDAPGSEEPGSEEKPRTKARELGSVDYELLKCARNPKDRSKIVFTFAVRCDNGRVQTVHGCRAMTLTLADGSVLEGEVVHVSNEMVMLTKGETTRFQVVYGDVDEDVTLIDDVAMTMGAPLGFPRSPIHFYRIKIQPR